MIAGFDKIEIPSVTLNVTLMSALFESIRPATEEACACANVFGVNVNTLESEDVVNTYCAESGRVTEVVRGNALLSTPTALTMSGVAESTIVSVPLGSPIPDPTLSAQRGLAFIMF